MDSLVVANINWVTKYQTQTCMISDILALRLDYNHSRKTFTYCNNLTRIIDLRPAKFQLILSTKKLSKGFKSTKIEKEFTIFFVLENTNKFCFIKNPTGEFSIF